MPAITLNWQPHFVSAAAAHPGAAWISLLQWRRNDNNTLMTNQTGVYVIENPLGSPVYAGQALNLRSRFNARSDALQDLRLDPAVVVPNHRVHVATLGRDRNLLSLAERWLVRSLYLQDQANVAHILNNIALTGPFTVPGGGLTITNNNNPPYLAANYNYLAGVII